MSTKHYFPADSVNTLVPKYLKNLTYKDPNLAYIESERVIYSKSHNRANVAVISGGGSGHEPSWSGYVGNGLLAGAACGDIFASPSMKQVLAAVTALPSDQGTILMITNYTGDRLHFGLAAERALATGFTKNIVVLPATDDVSIGKSKASIVGRRGMPGHMITMKIVGAAASKGMNFNKTVAFGKAINSQLVSIGSTLDHCHVPGRENHESIPDDICVVGAGIHNEPGAKKISPFPTVENLIAELLAMLCDPHDQERAFIKFSKGDEVVLLINNYGGLSELELGALSLEVLQQLNSTWSIKPIKMYSGAFESSLNGPGFSISLCNLTTAAENSESTVSEFIGLLNDATSALAWPNTSSIPLNTSREPIEAPEAASSVRTEVPESEDIKIEPSRLNNIARRGCERAIAAEPNLTKWDMVMGDGDCGEAVEGVSKAVLKTLDQTTKTGSIFDLLYATIDNVDDMGGTLGAILGIFLSALTTNLRSRTSSSPNYATATAAAVTALKQYTGAREGDRTVMDVLLPFAATFEETGDFAKAVAVAQEKAEATRYLKPKFGRASYVGAGGKEQELPDPGAWALKEMLVGMLEGAE